MVFSFHQLPHLYTFYIFFLLFAFSTDFFDLGKEREGCNCSKKRCFISKRPKHLLLWKIQFWRDVDYLGHACKGGAEAWL